MSEEVDWRIVLNVTFESANKYAFIINQEISESRNPPKVSTIKYPPGSCEARALSNLDCKQKSYIGNVIKMDHCFLRIGQLARMSSVPFE